MFNICDKVMVAGDETKANIGCIGNIVQIIGDGKYTVRLYLGEQAGCILWRNLEYHESELVRIQ